MIGLDLDGTLLNSEKRISEYTRSVLNHAIEKGVIVLPSTGRPVTGLPKEIIDFPGIRYAVTSNGARVVDLKENGKSVYECGVPVEKVKGVMKILSKYDTMREVYYKGHGYAAGEKIDEVERYMSNPVMKEYILATRIRVDDLDAYVEEHMESVDKVHILFADPEKEKMKAAREIEEMYPELNVTSALDNNLEINEAGANKGLALIELGRLLGIEREEIMACGDGLNDRAMIEEVGFGVAMENAMEEVKKVADYITVSNDEDGVAKAIEKFVLD
ncbi:MAG: Cof-type HAD-IIB family hydrolase [Eubacteriales bacterium]|nr:Cof-type HAD-IIB family hydrolase [Eubacteriales bacterium]